MALRGRDKLPAVCLAGRTGFTLARLIYAQRPPTHLKAIQVLNGGLCFRRRHFYETEAAWATRFAIIDQLDGLHGAMLLEKTANV